MTRPSFPGSIEPLESRIAPANTYNVGVGSIGFGLTYSDAPFVATTTGVGALHSDVVSAAVGGVFNAGTGFSDTFYLKMSTGDVLTLFSAFSFGRYVEVKGGNLIAFFVDKDHDRQVDAGELVSLSLGKDTSVIVNSALDGDIATNLNEHASTDPALFSLNVTSLVSEKQGIKALSVLGGGVGGNILAGGNIAGVTVTGTVSGIYAGEAAAGKTFRPFASLTITEAPTAPQGVVVVPQTAGVVGASISKISVAGVDTIQAGSGGDGAAGGSLSFINLNTDSNGFTLQAGQGGAGVTKANGGAGGSISSIFVMGSQDATLNGGGMLLAAGDGGLGSLSGVGGLGGSITTVKLGYNTSGVGADISAYFQQDKLTLTAGAGGNGKTGGLGGSISTVDARIATDNGAGDEISLLAGNGGDNLSALGGKSGGGGSVNTVSVRNHSSDIFTSIKVRAGNAGATAAGFALGGAGGSIFGATLLGEVLVITAGNGGAGKTGGNGGALKTITLEQVGDVIANSATFSAGFGGAGSAGNGGNGGLIDLVNTGIQDFQLLDFNLTTGGDGGAGAGGKGGVGGGLSRITISDDSFGVGGNATAHINAGGGGAGSTGGGAGGGISTTDIVANDLNVIVMAGDGGAANGAGIVGIGGAGGKVTSVQMAAQNDGMAAVNGSISGGAGGLGVTKGGLGGDVVSSGVNATGDVTLRAGSGGSAKAVIGGVGNGGSIVTSVGYAATGSGSLLAGDAGAAGAKAGIGGSVLGTSAKISGLKSTTNLTIQAGDGSLGGAGGSIKYVAYGGGTLGVAPSGNIHIYAGDGSALGAVAGGGGTIDNVTGTVSSGSTSNTQILAGNVIGALNATKSAAGGSVTNVTMLDGGAAGGVLVVEAGNANGDSALINTGMKGGDVRGLSVSNIDATLFRSVAGGAGGDASKTGGLGGSVSNIFAPGITIGQRTGFAYGYLTMGGIFAGIGGVAGVAGKTGKAGSVDGVVADAIAAIVAGRSTAPRPAESVSHITIPLAHQLDASAGALKVVANNFTGALDATYYATANFVGAVADITLTGAVGVSGATVFHYTDTNTNNKFDIGEVAIDGLICTNSFDQKTVNFTPQALYLGGLVNALNPSRYL